jgi:uncharacterized delta-60 repeat protein
LVDKNTKPDRRINLSQMFHPFISAKIPESKNCSHSPSVRKKMDLHKSLKLAAKLLLFLLLTAVARGQSALDGFDPNANGKIHVVVVQPDGKILIGGAFTTLSPNGGAPVLRRRLARLNPDGTLDTAFDPNAGGMVVRAIALQADGKILVGGFFGTIGGQMRNDIARLDAITGLADSFDPNMSGPVYAIAVQADGKILAGGFFTSVGGQPRNYMARLDAITGAADSFDPNAENAIEAIAVQTDGRILVGGDFTSIGGQTRNYIARLDPTNGLADSFDPNANDLVLSIAVQADGKILTAGFFDSIGGQPRSNIARLDASTGVADSFNPSANGSVLSLALQADGKILAGGYFTSIGGQTRHGIARLDSITGLADSFNANVVSTQEEVVRSIAVQADGKILAGGEFNGANSGQTRNNIARLETDGRLDRTLGDLGILDSFDPRVHATAVQPDGKILIGGNFDTVLGVIRNNIVRLNPDGTLDTLFNPDSNGAVYSIAVQADGKILASGFFNNIGGQPRNRIARLDGITGLADSFNPDAFDLAFSIVVQADGRILVGGSFITMGGQPHHYIARLDATTGLADSFNPNANDDVYSVVVQADGKILVGGDFSGANSIGGQLRNRIARLDPTTGLADSFNPNAFSTVRAITVQPDGKVLVGGNFDGTNSIGGQARNFIARLDATTGLADSFDPNATNPVESMSIQGDGKVLAAGAFTHIGGQPRMGIARLNAATGLADSFNANANNGAYSIAVQADGKILAGGPLTSVGGQSREHFTRLSNDTAALQNLAVTQTAVIWAHGGSSPQFTRVTFEFSTNNLSYTPLGNGTAVGSTWTLTGLNLPTGQNIYIRARGYYRSGFFNGSESIAESVRNAFLTGPTGTPTPTPPIPTPTATPTPPISTPTPSATPATPTPTPTPGATPTTLGNISTRLRVETGENVLIGGFIVTGTQPKRVILRAIGPSLPVAGALADPVLELRDSSGVLIRSNENWRSDQEAEIMATTIPPSNDLESAIVAILPANNSAYTAIVRGVNDGTGVGLIEAYDLDRTVNSKLANISTRGLVQTEENVLIAGTIVLGQAPQRVLVRAIGPSLPVVGKLEDPVLELRNGNGTLIRSNDNWRSDQEAEIIATTIPPSNDLESALIEILPGNGAAYTAIVRGVDNATGVGLVEVYALN